MRCHCLLCWLFFFDEAKEECVRLIKLHHLTNIPPYDDPRPCPKIKIIRVETYDANATTLSLKEKKRVTLDEVGLFADGAAIRVVGEETFRHTRSVVEPGCAFCGSVKKYIANNVTGGCFVVTSGANMNFERLRFVAERAKLGERTEALFSVIIPERPGSFIRLCDNMYPSKTVKDPPSLLEKLEANGYNVQDISDNEIVKSHARYMVGGRSKVENEQLYRFEFPERPGALKKFLSGLRSDWNISLFHYRNQGSDIWKVLVGIQVPPQNSEAFENFKNQLGYHAINETEKPVYKQFLRYCQDNI
ncbi:C-terminal regulatory domain of threonine dehydratase-domain-containing protein [Gigaspora rosea]|uniref:C-terminal regulatory domain of threonine dehydratase-domain-containing protein n=1 Tax=Gigaspora rosea TaxID=44941 RepID=A0A397U0Q6_9GLOM|nr:C-terminal regulatory domain of threonine dehydratase-domain-containing protein [Gigaspora rosea]